MDPSEGKEELKLFGWMNFSRADSKKSSSVSDNNIVFTLNL